MNPKMNNLQLEINQLLSESIPNSTLNTNLEESMLYSLNLWWQTHKTGSVVINFRNA